MHRLLFAMLFVAGIHGTCCSAADGDPDPGFADNGRLVIAPADASLQVYAAAVQRDGKLLLAGSRCTSAANRSTTRSCCGACSMTARRTRASARTE